MGKQARRGREGNEQMGESRRGFPAPKREILACEKNRGEQRRVGWEASLRTVGFRPRKLSSGRDWMRRGARDRGAGDKREWGVGEF